MSPTNAAPNFNDILDRPSSEIERPKPLPQGTYFCVVQGLPRHDKSSKKQTPFVEYTLKVTQAGEDVDQEELQAMGGIADKTIKATYYITEASVFMLKEFLDKCGVPEEEGGKDLSLRQRTEMATNCQIGVFMKHEASQDGESVFAKLDRTMAVE